METKERKGAVCRYWHEQMEFYWGSFINIFFNTNIMQNKNLWLLIPFSVIAIVLLISVLSFFGIFFSPLSTQSCGCHSMMPNSSLLILGILLILAVKYLTLPL